ncbi:winged helix-turn-helix domain-containing protein [Thiococcus pfennigii]|uniref:winged helix-turn-helix domain-containing protein n=1 Tax=Thiococcus pfennigii TaxID=1057 RepID=UPI00190548BF|nr:winged helix-turn-helix domain-containing protein [Thiococcus pfennigii]MBK1731323.1 hypothetical protein [Thiococcus pfennigii]
MESIPSDVDEAFEILLEVIEEDVSKYLDALGPASSERNFAEARKILEHAEKISDFRMRVAAIRKEWRSLQGVMVEHPAAPRNEEPVSQQPLPTRRLARGQRTREEEFYLSILTSLIELNGSAPVAEVLDKVYEKMKHGLKEADLQILESQNMPRWRNTAMWARKNLKDEKLLKSDSRFGVWEITDAGRAWAKAEQAKSSGPQ